jgi:hypothetical protein
MLAWEAFAKSYCKEGQMTTDEKSDLQKIALRRSIFKKPGLKYREWQVLSKGLPQPQKFLDLASVLSG